MTAKELMEHLNDGHALVCFQVITARKDTMKVLDQATDKRVERPYISVEGFIPGSPDTIAMANIRIWPERDPTPDDDRAFFETEQLLTGSIGKQIIVKTRRIDRDGSASRIMVKADPKAFITEAAPASNP